MDYVEELIIASLKELLELRSITEVDSNTKSKLVYRETRRHKKNK